MVLIVGKASLVVGWRLPFFLCVSITWGFCSGIGVCGGCLWVGVAGVCGWVFMNPAGRGVCSEATHPPDPHTDGTYAYGVDKYVVWCWLVGLAVCGVGG